MKSLRTPRKIASQMLPSCISETSDDECTLEERCNEDLSSSQNKSKLEETSTAALRNKEQQTLTENNEKMKNELSLKFSTISAFKGSSSNLRSEYNLPQTYDSEELSGKFQKISAFKETSSNIKTETSKTDVETDELKNKFKKISALKPKAVPLIKRDSVQEPKVESDELGGLFKKISAFKGDGEEIKSKCTSRDTESNELLSKFNTISALKSPNREQTSKLIARSVSFNKDIPDPELSSLFGKISSLKENSERKIGSLSRIGKPETDELATKFTKISALNEKPESTTRSVSPRLKPEGPELSSKFQSLNAFKKGSLDGRLESVLKHEKDQVSGELEVKFGHISAFKAGSTETLNKDKNLETEQLNPELVNKFDKISAFSNAKVDGRLNSSVNQQKDKADDELVGKFSKISAFKEPKDRVAVVETREHEITSTKPSFATSTLVRSSPNMKRRGFDPNPQGYRRTLKPYGSCDELNIDISPIRSTTSSNTAASCSSIFARRFGDPPGEENLSSYRSYDNLNKLGLGGKGADISNTSAGSKYATNKKAVSMNHSFDAPLGSGVHSSKIPRTEFRGSSTLKTNLRKRETSPLKSYRSYDQLNIDEKDEHSASLPAAHKKAHVSNRQGRVGKHSFSSKISRLPVLKPTERVRKASIEPEGTKVKGMLKMYSSCDKLNVGMTSSSKTFKAKSRSPLKSYGSCNELNIGISQNTSRGGADSGGIGEGDIRSSFMSELYEGSLFPNSGTVGATRKSPVVTIFPEKVEFSRKNSKCNLNAVL